MKAKEKYCIICNLPDGLNVFAGFEKIVNPLTGSTAYFNVWQLAINNETLGKARLFRSQSQAEQALKLVDGKQIVYANVQPFSKVQKQINGQSN